MNNFERKFGKYAISNLSLYLVMGYAVGFLINMVAPQMILFMTLNPYEILHGQIWRLFTWVLIPPNHSGIFWTIIALYCCYSIGNALEQAWGVWRYNVYIFSGILFTIIGSFLFMGYCYLFHGNEIQGITSLMFDQASLFFTTIYINMSILLAFAATFPDTRFYLMFILPIKAKWLGIAYGVLLVMQFLSGGNSWYSDAIVRFTIASSFLNFVVFFLISKSRSGLSPKQIKRRMQYKTQVKENTRIAKHKCAICGRTSDEFPDLQFRFCSKCDGNYEYCQDHLFTHEHVKKNGKD